MSTLRYVIVCFFILWILPSTTAQENILEKKISLHLEDIALSEVLDSIAKKAKISFSYSTRSIPIDKHVSIYATNQPLYMILDDLLLGMEVEYLWVEGKMILRKERRGPDNSKTYTISGYIRDKEDGETLIGATVLLTASGMGTISNSYGYYSITLPPGVYTLNFSYIGYESVSQEIRLSKNLNLDLSLIPKATLLESVVVTLGDSIQTIENVHSNITQLSANTIVQKPAALGEPDVIKSLDILPGIQLFNDGSVFFNVRGGNRDQNQILVDEAPIYNPAHLLGLFSSFMPAAIKGIKIYKGNADADFGGRISSVMDIHTKDGNFKKMQMSGRLGLVTTRLAIEGPIQKDRSSFFLAGRRSHIQSFVSSEDFDTFRFSDFTGKVNLKINAHNRLFLSVFSSHDEYLTNEGLAWENIAGTIRWNHIFNDRLFANTTLYSSKYQYRLITSPTRIWANHIANASLKTDFTFYKGLESTIKFGFRLSGHNFNPGNIEGDENGPFVPKRNATELSLYYSHEKVLTRKWLLTYGLRLSSWTNYGRTIEYAIDENHQVTDTTIYNDRRSYNDYTNIEPRIKLTYLLNNINLFTFNYSRSAQYINLISNSISPFNNLEVWLPASINIKPQLADQISIGWTHVRKKWKFTMETYYKTMYNQLDYANQAELLLNPQFETEIRSGDGTAYGIEANLVKKTGKLTGNITYAFARSFRKIEGINEGRRYPALSDRPAQFSAHAVWKKNMRTHFSGTLIVSSGSPITTPTSFYQFAGRTVPIYAQKNNDRLPTYHRFDLGWSHRLNKIKHTFNHFISISIYNFYGHKNSVLRSFNKIIWDDGKLVVPANINNPEQLKATHTYVYQVVPSVSYSFNL